MFNQIFMGCMAHDAGFKISHLRLVFRRVKVANVYIHFLQTGSLNFNSRQMIHREHLSFFDIYGQPLEVGTKAMIYTVSMFCSTQEDIFFNFAVGEHHSKNIALIITVSCT